MKLKPLLMGATLLLTASVRSIGYADSDLEKPQDRWVDLSYAFSEETLYWPTSEPFSISTVAEGVTEGGYFYSVYHFSTSEHGGTHLDAPKHFAAGGWANHEIPVHHLTGPGIVVDVSNQVATNRDYLIQVDDLERFIRKHGPIPEDALLFFRTGFDRYWPDAKKYLGTSERGPRAVKHLHFPGLAPDLAKHLITHTNIRAVGIDTASLDYGQSKTFESHQILAGANIIGFENVASLADLPPLGFTVYALPMKIEGSSGGPVRIIAQLPADE